MSLLQKVVVQHLDLTDDKAAVLAQELAAIVEYDRLPLCHISAPGATATAAGRNQYFRYISTATRRVSPSTTNSPKGRRCFCGSSRAWTCWSRTIGQSDAARRA
jgi:hypothetical protein